VHSFKLSTINHINFFLKAIPNDLSFRKEFIDICRQCPDKLQLMIIFIKGKSITLMFKIISRTIYINIFIIIIIIIIIYIVLQKALE
jgi:hypothetical protein